MKCATGSLLLAARVNGINIWDTSRAADGRLPVAHNFLIRVSYYYFTYIVLAAFLRFKLSAVLNL